MSERFTAMIYCKEKRIAIQTGDNIEQLFTWMLIQVNGSFDDMHGEIIDNNTQKVVRRFCKSPIE